MTNTASTSAAPSTDVDLGAIMAVLARQKRVLIYSFAAIMTAAAAFVALVPPVYTATALVYVNPEERDALGSASRSTPGGENARVDSEVEILRSDAVALSVIDAAALQTDPEFGARSGTLATLAGAVGIAHAAPTPQAAATARTLARFSKSVSVRRRGLTYLISVSVSSRSPDRAAELANALSGAYIAQQVQSKIADNASVRDVVSARIARARERLTAYEAAIDGIIRQYASDGSKIGVAPDVAQLRASLAEISARRDHAAALASSAASQLTGGDWSALAQTLQDQALAEMEDQRQELLGTLSQPAGASDVTLRAELARIEAALARRTAAALNQLGESADLLDKKAADLDAQIRGRLVSTDVTPEQLTEVYSLQQEATIARAQYQELLGRLRDLETRSEIQIADSTIVSAALPPVSPAFPDKGLVFLAALALSLGAGVSLAFLNEYVVGGVTSAGQLAELTGHDTATAIPRVSDANSGRQSPADRIVDAPLSVFSEASRKLRAAVDQEMRRRNPDIAIPTTGQVIMVTSALPSEGKTTTALALARTYAQTGRKTLLIDGDLRRPFLHRHLGLQPKVGLLDYLRDPEEAAISDGFYVRDVVTPLAMILGAGNSEFATDQLLTSRRFERLLEQARQIYDVTVIDTSPLLPVVDARYVAPRADAVVLAVKWAATSQGDLRNAIQVLHGCVSPRTPLLPVLTQAQASERATDYAYGADSYSAAI